VPSAELSAGAVIAGDFRVVRPLGRGGMGVVYLVDQLSTGKRRALKVMQEDVAQDASARERFVQEAKVGALVASEHVVEAIAAGVDAQAGVQWLAMELLEGEDLAAYVRRRGALPPSAAAEVLEQLCRGLAAAHAMRVVHRDLKPENIFLARRPRDASVLVKLLDFGIAKVLRVDLTATGAVGTPLWMAPEQSSAHARVAPSTDVWALGLLVFHVLTGGLYWRSPGSAMALMREVLVEPLPAPSVRARELGSGVELPEAFDAWFFRCVAREPEARFTEAGEAWEALAPILASMPGEPARVLPALNEAARATPIAPSPYDPTIPAPPSVSGAGISGDAPTQAQSQPHAQAQAQAQAQAHAQAQAQAQRTRRLLTLAGAVAVLAIGTTLTVRAYRYAGHPEPASPAGARDTTSQDALTGRMVHFAGGTFLMGFDGTPQTAPRHSVTVGPFDLDATEVTVKAYTLCVGAGACPNPTATSRTNWGVPGREDHPVNGIDWAAARGFCVWAGKRLPTEAEWEFAAVGGAAQRKYAWGDAEPSADGVCWSRDPNTGSTCKVGSSPQDRTPEGLRDMGGNVTEWTEDRLCAYSDPGCTRDSGIPIPMRVTRGGEWAESKALLLSPWFRSMAPDYGANEYMGVRCARDSR
jgi:formylglycine-generating enzyme required for sulfatase activity/serine/threonine protein kinase